MSNNNFSDNFEVINGTLRVKSTFTQPVFIWSDSNRIRCLDFQNALEANGVTVTDVFKTSRGFEFGAQSYVEDEVTRALELGLLLMLRDPESFQGTPNGFYLISPLGYMIPDFLKMILKKLRISLDKVAQLTLTVAIDSSFTLGVVDKVHGHLRVQPPIKLLDKAERIKLRNELDKYANSTGDEDPLP